jgi:tetratricopeptide (TPR) repeat protein
VKHVKEGSRQLGQKDYVAALAEFSAAELAGRESLRLRPADPLRYKNLRNVYSWIDTTQEKLSNANEKMALLSTVLYVAEIEALLTPDNSSTEVNDALQAARTKFGMYLFDKNQLGLALAMVQEEIAESERLVEKDQRNATYLYKLGNAECGLGMVRRERQKEAGWEEAIRSGLIHVQKAAEINSKGPEYLNEVGDWRIYLGKELDADGRKEEALAEYRLALSAYQTVARRFPGNKKAEEAIHNITEHGVQ